MSVSVHLDGKELARPTEEKQDGNVVFSPSRLACIDCGGRDIRIEVGRREPGAPVYDGAFIVVECLDCKARRAAAAPGETK